MSLAIEFQLSIEKDNKKINNSTAPPGGFELSEVGNIASDRTSPVKKTIKAINELDIVVFQF